MRSENLFLLVKSESTINQKFPYSEMTEGRLDYKYILVIISYHLNC